MALEIYKQINGSFVYTLQEFLRSFVFTLYDFFSFVSSCFVQEISFGINFLLYGYYLVKGYIHIQTHKYSIEYNRDYVITFSDFVGISKMC